MELVLFPTQERPTGAIHAQRSWSESAALGSVQALWGSVTCMVTTGSFKQGRALTTWLSAFHTVGSHLSCFMIAQDTSSLCTWGCSSQAEETGHPAGCCSTCEGKLGEGVCEAAGSQSCHFLGLCGLGPDPGWCRGP